MFTVISKDTFDMLQLDAGVLLKSFNPDSPAAPSDSDIICATTGGIKADCIPSYIDMGEDVDNCPMNTKELKKHTGWDCRLGFTSLRMTPDAIKLALGAADISGNKVTLRGDLEDEDFADIWWVGDRSDGGLVAICLKNALSTGGFSLQTTKNGKGQVACELTGHISIADTTVMPMEFYATPATAA